MQTIKIKPGGLVLLSGGPGSGKSTGIRRCFSLKEIEHSGVIQSSDAWRKKVFGSEPVFVDDQVGRRPRATNDKLIFRLMREVVEARMKAGQLTVVDATLLTDEVRSQFAELAELYWRDCVVVILNTPVEECVQRNKGRENPVPESVIREMASRLELKSKYRHVVVDGQWTLEVDWLTVPPLEEIVVVGDVHGCLGPLKQMIEKAKGRQMLFLGDVVDRGPESVQCLLLIKKLVEEGQAWLLMGNHELTVLKGLTGRLAIESRASKGTMHSVLKQGLKKEVIAFLSSLPPGAIGEDGVRYCHAEQSHWDLVNCETRRLVSGVLHPGEERNVDGEWDEFGSGLLIHGHIPSTGPSDWAISLDRGCGFGGPLVGIIDGEVIEVPSVFDYSKRPETFFDQLKRIDKKWWRSQTNDHLTIVKYSKAAYFNEKIWADYPILKKVRGLVLGLDGNPVNRVFERYPHWHEVSLDPNEQVVCVDKINGFLGQAFLNPYNRDEVVLACSGSFSGEHWDLLRKHIFQGGYYPKLLNWLRVLGGTFLFECVDVADPHIIQEKEGLWLIGYGVSEFANEAQLDSIGAELGVQRPQWEITTAEQARRRANEEKIEGFMLRSLEGEYLCKLKTSHYLLTKFFSRLSEKNAKFMVRCPDQFLKEFLFDELELEPLVRAIVDEVGEEWLDFSEEKRKAWCRGRLNEV